MLKAIKRRYRDGFSKISTMEFSICFNLRTLEPDIAVCLVGPGCAREPRGGGGVKLRSRQ